MRDSSFREVNHQVKTIIREIGDRRLSGEIAFQISNLDPLESVIVLESMIQDPSDSESMIALDVMAQTYSDRYINLLSGLSYQEKWHFSVVNRCLDIDYVSLLPDLARILAYSMNFKAREMAALALINSGDAWCLEFVGDFKSDTTVGLDGYTLGSAIEMMFSDLIDLE